MSDLTFDAFIERLRIAWRVDLPEPIDPVANLYEDLGVDSFKAFELLIAVEVIAECLVPPVEIPEIFTLADSYTYYQSIREADEW